MKRSIGGFIALCLFLLISTAALAGDRASRNAPECCVVVSDCCSAACPTAACR